MSYDPDYNFDDVFGNDEEEFSPEEAAQEEEDFQPVPAGVYNGEVKTAELRPTKAGGLMLAVSVKIDGPTHSGRFVWGNINMKHPTSKQAESIGRKEFAALCLSCGYAKRRPEGVEDLLDKEVKIKVVQREWNGEKRSEIRRFLRPESVGKTKTKTTAKAEKPAQTTEEVKRTAPWKR